MDAVTIATPTIYHLEAAQPLLERGIGCLIEKPLAPTAEVADAIAESAEEAAQSCKLATLFGMTP